MLMAALMGGVPEVVVWNIVGEGAKKGHANPWIRFLAFGLPALKEQLPESGDSAGWKARNKKVSRLWKKLKDDEKDVFRDPYFFALADLPNLSKVPEDLDSTANPEDEGNTSLQHLDESTATPLVHKLTAEEKAKYQPLFDKLVDKEKLHTCHGKPSPTSSVATVQKRSLLELRKAHHAFAVVCQRYQITYYLAGVSCGSAEGWRQVFSNNTSFANWASKDQKIPETLASYIHGQSAAKIVEGSESKLQQPSDERKTRLGRELNRLLNAVYKDENVFPKLENPAADILEKGWPIRIVQKPGSQLSEEALNVGHRRAKGLTVKAWLDDIKNGLFVIEHIPDSELANRSKQQQSKKSKKKSQSTTSQIPSNPQHPDEPTNTANTNSAGIQPSQANKSCMKRKLKALAKGEPAQNKKSKRQKKTRGDSDSDSDSNSDSNSGSDSNSSSDPDSSSDSDSNSSSGSDSNSNATSDHSNDVDMS
ncbi:uncharacterized protein MELLADRAFT_85569 [Melampsora larici-populina 98AG31]|uniref:Uncharacterized protein n=1 Tax=Melampsora larici-populina (strain 98AG31 / pathotype 3-4-7) TaxID=747676 RepID=F4RID8_MELLP|nr:uncharacterized protein MELLADRAFT_85569 [Melampsora larici-populina 98AG31]EGG07684.1 hypothetical protein MELLADRAFT_85569 [Melampsora larici-populina 98AG31]